MIRTGAHGGIRLVMKESSWSLLRTAPDWAIEGLPAGLVETARQAITEGWKVKVVSSAPRVTASVLVSLTMLTAPIGGISWLLTGGRSIIGESWGSIAFISLILMGLAGMFTLMLNSVDRQVFFNPAIAAQAQSLAGEAVEGRGRASIDLWHKAIKQLEDGHRGRKSLVAVHAKLIEVADAEDLVDKLRESSKYKTDTIELDAALTKVAGLIAEATVMVTGTAPALGTGPKLNNVWTSDAVLPEAELANADELR